MRVFKWMSSLEANLNGVTDSEAEMRENAW